MNDDYQKKVIEIPELVSYENYGFKQCVQYGNLIFVTGQAGQYKDGTLVANDVETQTRQIFKNIQIALKAAHSDLTEIVAMTSYIVDIGKNGLAYFKTRKECMPVTSFTSTSVGVAGLAEPGMWIEVTCIAAVKK